jgi:hypothetical protein
MRRSAAGIGHCSSPMGAGTALAASLSAIAGGTGDRAAVVRAWFFESMAVTGGRRDWSGFDNLLRVARAHRLLVIPVLANQWGECERPGGRSDPRGSRWRETIKGCVLAGVGDPPGHIPPRRGDLGPRRGMGS